MSKLCSSTEPQTAERGGGGAIDPTCYSRSSKNSSCVRMAANLKEWLSGEKVR